MSSNLLFQYIQKLVILSPDHKNVLVAKRKGEADYDGTFSFVGGKMETTDESLVAGMKREKDEEIGSSAKVKVLPNETFNVLFRKSSGQMSVNPHTPAVFVAGEIKLNPDEYSEYRWVGLEQLDALEPKIANIPMITRWALRKLDQANPKDLVNI